MPALCPRQAIYCPPGAKNPQVSRTIWQVTKTASSTPCFPNRPLQAEGRVSRRAVLAWGVGSAAVSLVPGGMALAQAHPSEVLDLSLERADDGWYLSARMAFELPAPIADALDKGIPLHFVAEVQVLRQRWYWTDREVASSSRYVRLAFVPLTRRWRLQMSASPLVRTGLGVALGQTYETLDDALAAMQRIARWKIAEPELITPDAVHTVQFRFRLDPSQLPRPLQLSALGRSGGNLQLTRSLRLPAAQGGS